MHSWSDTQEKFFTKLQHLGTFWVTLIGILSQMPSSTQVQLSRMLHDRTEASKSPIDLPFSAELQPLAMDFNAD